MHILEFVRKHENFTMEQKVTYKKNKSLTRKTSLWQSNVTEPIL